MNGVPVKFELASLFGQSWEIFKKNLGPLLGATALMFVIGAVGMAVVGLVVKIGPLAVWILLGPLQLGLYKMIRQAMRGEPVDFNLLFSGFSRVPDAYLAGLLIGLFSSIGAIFCIIPGAIIGTAYQGTFLFMNEKNLAFWDAMEASRKMAINNLGQWVILALALLALNLIGMIPCGLGLLVTTPMTYLIIAMAYDLEQNATIDVVAQPVPPMEPPSA